MKKFAVAGLMTVSLLTLSGCSGEGGGGGGGAGYDKELRAIGLAYHDYFSANNKGPMTADDLAKNLSDQKALSLLRSGDIVFIWNVHLIQGMPDGTVNTIVAYEKQVPEKGGVVLFGDGAVRKVSADEYNKAPKARPK